jgi:ribokinase
MVARVIVVGSVNIDFMVVTPRLPGPGQTVTGGELQRFGGGKGANAAVAAARAGAEVRLVAAVGDDDTGRAAVDELQAERVDTSDVAILPGVATGVALIVVDENGENQIALGPGANGALTAGHVKRALERNLASAGCVLVSTEIPDDAVIAAVEAARAGGRPCVLNPAPVVAAVVAAAGHGPILTPNETELADLGQRLGIADTGGDRAGLLAAVSRRTGAPVIVTLGPAGVATAHPDGRFASVPAASVEARDSTGAGDTFNGVLAARLARGDELDTATRAAVAAATLSVQVVGARSGMPTDEAIDAVLG